MSADTFLGVPFNIASYALLVYIISDMTGLKPGKFIHTFGDAHIYLNHLDQVKKQMTRKPKDVPTLKILNSHDKIEDYTEEDFLLENYFPHPAIKGDLSVGL